MNLDLNKIPLGWFLQELKHVHTDILFRDERHRPKHWQIAIQHEKGGRRSMAIGHTPEQALDRAIAWRSEPGA